MGIFVKSKLELRVLYTFLIFTLIISACRKDELKIVQDSSSMYFPIELGNKWTYQMDSIVYNGDIGRPIDTFQYFIRREVQDTFLNDQDEKVFVIYQYYKSDSLSKWTYQHSYNEMVNSESVIRNRNDRKEVVISFPIAQNKEWDSNIFNTDDRSESYYEDIHQPFTIGSSEYDSTSTVIRELGEDYILADSIFKETVFIDLGIQEDQFFTNIEYEVYAKDIGLIKQFFQDLEQQPDKYLQGSEYVRTFNESNW